MRCTIKFKGVSYVKYMSFGLMVEPLTKVQRTDSGSIAGSYALAYEYGDADHPTAPSQIGHERYTNDFERLSEVLYPKNLFNRVTYTYPQRRITQCPNTSLHA